MRINRPLLLLYAFGRVKQRALSWGEPFKSSWGLSMATCKREH